MRPGPSGAAMEPMAAEEALVQRTLADLRATGELGDGTFFLLMHDIERLSDAQLEAVLNALKTYGTPRHVELRRPTRKVQAVAA
jgi:hypothetical protein